MGSSLLIDFYELRFGLLIFLPQLLIDGRSCYLLHSESLQDHLVALFDFAHA